MIFGELPKVNSLSEIQVDDLVNDSYRSKLANSVEENPIEQISQPEEEEKK